MKVIGLLFSFVFFAIKCKSETIEVYNDLIQKLEKLESLSVDGLELFQKSQVIINATQPTETIDPFTNHNFAQQVQDFVTKFEGLGFTEQTELVNLIKALTPNRYGVKYLIESKEEFNGLMHAINFYYDVLRDKLNDMCANNYCEIPEHLKISEEETEMLKKVILGYRKPIENIQDDIEKLEIYIERNKETVAALNALIAEETKKIQPEGNEDCNDASCDSDKYNKKKPIYQAMYNVIFYKKQLAEIQKVVEVLEKRVSTLKKNDAIKPLWQQIEVLNAAPVVTAETQIVTGGQSSTEPGSGGSSASGTSSSGQASAGTGVEQANTVASVTVTPSVGQNGEASTNPQTAQVQPVPTLTLEEKQKKIAGLYAQIKEIAKTIKFNLEGIFVDPIELEYFKKEKKKESCNLSTSSCKKNKASETIIPLTIRYPNGISYPLPENDVYNKIANNAAETTYGDLTH
nr:merozoite surface protein 1 [Plasmodium yoelii yoelii]